MNTAPPLNTAWMWKCGRELRRFRRATTQVARTQTALLREIISRNCRTVYGVQHRFCDVTSPGEYQQHVPLSDYDTYADLIDCVAHGESNVLTRDPVRLLEPTSGTTHGEKLIPYTRGLRIQFQRGIAAWISDLFQHRPDVRRGRAYWSISPAFGGARRSAGGIPIGFDDDTAYLSSWERRIVDRLLAVPSTVARLPDIETFQYQTLLHLLAAEDLALISVWSPTFLTTLLSQLHPWHERLLRDLRRGTSVVAADVRRAKDLQRILATDVPPADQLRLVWPSLALVSCWADGASATMLPEARRLMPHVEFQPKGLVSTEAFVSLPLVGQAGAALAIRSHFFEFEEIDSPASATAGPGRLRLAHQLQHGGNYRVVVTTAGGLYRYRLYDEVTVTGFINECPLLRFVGKSDGVSDLVGEKLNEPHVRRVLDGACHELQLAPSFAMLAPVAESPPRYRLYFQAAAVQQEPVNVDRLAARLQRGLEENPHYRLAIDLGQLSPVEISVLGSSRPSAWTMYERRRMANGRKLGDIKPTALDPWTGWADVFAAAQYKAESPA